MASTKNALIRYKTIDTCLQNGFRKWTLQDLIEACSDALQEYEGKEAKISKRTIQLDIQLMRSDKLGYNAPIEVYDKKYYRYAEQGFSIMNVPINDSDMAVLTETITMLKQFKDFSFFSDLTAIVQRLEDKVYSESTHQHPIIHMDKNENLKGLAFLELLYQSIVKQLVLKMEYKSFKATNVNTFSFHPYLLKEYNNRWFVLGKRQGERKLHNLALDRIEAIDYDLETEYLPSDFDRDAYYSNTIGVTVHAADQVEEIHLKFSKIHAPYVETKPLHHSQRILKRLEDGAIEIAIDVHYNFELVRVLLGFGAGLTVLKPLSLKRTIKRSIAASLKNYD